MKPMPTEKITHVTWVLSKIRQARAEGNEEEARRLQKEFIECSNKNASNDTLFTLF